MTKSEMQLTIDALRLDNSLLVQQRAAAEQALEVGRTKYAELRSAYRALKAQPRSSKSTRPYGLNIRTVS